MVGSVADLAVAGRCATAVARVPENRVEISGLGEFGDFLGRVGVENSEARAEFLELGVEGVEGVDEESQARVGFGKFLEDLGVEEKYGENFLGLREGCVERGIVVETQVLTENEEGFFEFFRIGHRSENEAKR